MVDRLMQTSTASNSEAVMAVFAIALLIHFVEANGIYALAYSIELPSSFLSFIPGFKTKIMGDILYDQEEEGRLVGTSIAGWVTVALMYVSAILAYLSLDYGVALLVIALVLYAIRSILFIVTLYKLYQILYTPNESLIKTISGLILLPIRVMSIYGFRKEV